MNNMMEQFEKFVDSQKESSVAEPAIQPTEVTPEFVDNVIYVDFKKRSRIAK